MTRNAFKGESQEYRRQRDRLLEAEIALKDQIERVAELRRQLPQGAAVEVDYIFREGPTDINDESSVQWRDTRLTELFTKGKEQLLVIHMMFGADDELPCEMCNMSADGYNAVAPYVSDKVNFVLITKAEIGKLRRWARSRGWSNIRLLSSHGTTFNKDFLVGAEDGSQKPGVSVFSRLSDGTIHHCYTTEASLADGHHRGIDLFTPVWNLFDLLPDGRGEWMPQLSYE